jgi:hypothetical protein
MKGFGPGRKRNRYQNADQSARKVLERLLAVGASPGEIRLLAKPVRFTNPTRVPAVPCLGQELRIITRVALGTKIRRKWMRPDCAEIAWGLGS